MDKLELIEELRGIIRGYLENRQLVLVDLIYRYEGPELFLRLLVDRPEGGITLGECATVNNEVGLLLDEKNILQQRYILEVSSPGADRPLRNKDDFFRCINRRAKFFLNELIDARLELEGVVREAGSDSVRVEVDGKDIEIPLSKINKAKQVF